MMKLPYIHISPKKRHDPGKEFWKKRTAHGRVHPKSGKGLEQKDQESDEVNKSRQVIVADRIDLFVLYL